MSDPLDRFETPQAAYDWVKTHQQLVGRLMWSPQWGWYTVNIYQPKEFPNGRVFPNWPHTLKIGGRKDAPEAPTPLCR